jgi:hypothetical protein
MKRQPSGIGLQHDMIYLLPLLFHLLLLIQEKNYKGRAAPPHPCRTDTRLQLPATFAGTNRRRASRHTTHTRDVLACYMTAIR